MLLLSLVIVFSLCFFTEGTLAFNKQNARSYADQYAIHNNTYGYRTFASDCTNFVSQVMKSGGLSTGPHWYYNSGMNYSATWTVADQFETMEWEQKLEVGQKMAQVALLSPMHI